VIAQASGSAHAHDMARNSLFLQYFSLEISGQETSVNLSIHINILFCTHNNVLCYFCEQNVQDQLCN